MTCAELLSNCLYYLCVLVVMSKFVLNMLDEPFATFGIENVLLSYSDTTRALCILRFRPSEILHDVQCYTGHFFLIANRVQHLLYPAFALFDCLNVRLVSGA